MRSLSLHGGGIRLRQTDRQTDTPTWRAHARAVPFFPAQRVSTRVCSRAATRRPLIRAHDDFTTGRGGSLRHQRALQLREALADVGACAAAHAAWQVLHIDVLGYFLII